MSEQGREFADWPKSITEARADRSENGADWLPRDALIATLREIDRGELNPTGLVIVIREPKPGDDRPANFQDYVVTSRCAGVGTLETIGLLFSATAMHERTEG